VRRQAVWTRWIENRGPWSAFRARLRSELPKHYSTGETYATDDGALRCLVYLPRELRTPTSNWVVVGCVSLLAPVYFVYGVEYDQLGDRLLNHRSSRNASGALLLPRSADALTRAAGPTRRRGFTRPARARAADADPA
jgi:hypothetical protein